MIEGPIKKGRYFFAISLFILIDRLVKSILIEMPFNESLFKVIPNLFEIRTLINTGIAFGLFRNLPGVFLVLNFVLVVFLLCYFAIRLSRKDTIFAYILILSGAISNLIDRLLYGGVLDYFDFIAFPTFNIADVYITFGVIFILKDVFSKKTKTL